MPGERRVGELGKGQWAARCGGALDQIVAAGRDRRPQHPGDGLEIRDAGLHVVKLPLCPMPKPVTVARGVAVPGSVEDACNLLQREPERLGVLITRTVVAASSG